jgi:hypothetical protein
MSVPRQSQHDRLGIADPIVCFHLKQISARTVNPPVFCVSQAG